MVYQLNSSKGHELRGCKNRVLFNRYELRLPRLFWPKNSSDRIYPIWAPLQRHGLCGIYHKLVILLATSCFKCISNWTYNSLTSRLLLWFRWFSWNNDICGSRLHNKRLNLYRSSIKRWRKAIRYKLDGALGLLFRINGNKTQRHSLEMDRIQWSILGRFNATCQVPSKLQFG